MTTQVARDVRAEDWRRLLHDAQHETVIQEPDGCVWEEVDAGPHPGCIEFAPPVYYPCGQPATTHRTTENPYPAPGEPDTEELPLCAHHAEQFDVSNI